MRPGKSKKPAHGSAWVTRRENQGSDVLAQGHLQCFVLEE